MTALRRLLLRASALVVLASCGAGAAFAQQVTLFFDDFDANRDGTWAVEQNVSVTDPGSLVGSNVFYFDGAGKGGGRTQAQSERWSATETLDLTAGGAEVSFWLRYEGKPASTGDVPQFEKFDHGDDDLKLQYQVSGGSWVTVTTFGNNRDTFRTGASYSVELPSVAWASSVQIRIWQSGKKNQLGTDQFAIDDFKVVANPEPGTCGLFAAGAAALAVLVRRRRAYRGRRSDASRSA